MIKLRSWLMSAWNVKVSASAICTSAITAPKESARENEGKRESERILESKLFVNEWVWEIGEEESVYYIVERRQRVSDSKTKMEGEITWGVGRFSNLSTALWGYLILGFCIFFLGKILFLFLIFRKILFFCF